MKAIGMALAVGSIAGNVWAQDCTDPLVNKPEDAGHIAFMHWQAVNPSSTASGEKEWLSHFTITLRDCVWLVAQKPIPPSNYSTFVIHVGAKDGGILAVELSD